MDASQGTDESNDQSSSTGSKPVTEESSYPSSSERTARRRQQLAAQETLAVTCGKFSMVVLLLTVAMGAGVAVFHKTSKEEKTEMTRRFTNLALQVLSVGNVNVQNIVDTYGNFANQVSSFAVGTNAAWPFVTLPLFEATTSRIMAQTGSVSLAISHVVTPDQREEWESFTATNASSWMVESLAYLQLANDTKAPYVAPTLFDDLTTFDPIDDPVAGYDYFTPIWQYAPLINQSSLVNYESLSSDPFATAFPSMVKQNVAVLSDVINLGNATNDSATWPLSILTVPIYSEVSSVPDINKLVATVATSIPWHRYFAGQTEDISNELVLVISNAKNQTFSYFLKGPTVTYLGLGSLHDPLYEEYAVHSSFTPSGNDLEAPFTVSLYPTAEFTDAIITDTPLLYTSTVVCFFVFTIGVFLIYDCFVERRQVKVLLTAERSNAIVNSLFPQGIADRLLEDLTNPTSQNSHTHQAGRANKISFADGDGYHQHKHVHHPFSARKHIAELFPAATVVFADIVGFTAWSSEREPSQVFELLEQIYSSFDQIAKRRKVFKVETIGDCYMAAAGLPEKRDDHAIVMARFARDCLRKMLQVVRKLESQLGPSTGDLGLRVGIHSGPVTAGVLRGEKARFQLFGDTVNTAARMESTGIMNKIQVSAETAALIAAADTDELWVLPREDQIDAKGKGMLSTFWLAYANMGAGRSSYTGASVISNPDDSLGPTVRSDVCDATTEMLEDTERERLNRSIDWAVDVLQSLLKRIVAIRGGEAVFDDIDSTVPVNFVHATGTRPLDEVVEVINLHSQTRSYPVDPSTIAIPPVVLKQLRTYVSALANTYHNNFFHNFEHATHVTMSVAKLLTRVVTPNEDCHDIERVMHEYTFGITSDPLAQFAVAFSALIHDADHPGVPNATLVKEGTDCAIRYKNQSVAEQNSVDLAWEMLAEPTYADLRACICNTQEEFQRFRQLVVNVVMATDIADRQLGAARKARWQKAFAAPSEEQAPASDEDSETDANRKATIVIEHLIQASDVAHTMQHWHIYIRWNERFFCECYQAYLDGRSEKDPSIDWYKSELSFFDFYIIPLAKKLKECQVFGVASDEYLNYASVNRQEWELKGQEAVKTYLHNFRKKLAKRERQVEAGL